MNPKIRFQIERTAEVVEGRKNQHVPYVTRWYCPDCAAENEIDHMDHEFHEPAFGEPLELQADCARCTNIEGLDFGDKGSFQVVCDIVLRKPDEALVPLSKAEVKILLACLDMADTDPDGVLSNRLRAAIE